MFNSVEVAYAEGTVETMNDAAVRRNFSSDAFAKFGNIARGDRAALFVEIHAGFGGREFHVARQPDNDSFYIGFGAIGGSFDGNPDRFGRAVHVDYFTAA